MTTQRLSRIASLCGMIVGAGCATTASLPPYIQADSQRVSSTPGQALYVVNNDTNTVTVYDPGIRKISRTLTAPQMLGPSAIAFDASGNAYVANAGGGPSNIPGAIFVYKPGADKPYRTISAGLDSPDRLVFDSSGNLYVANFGFKFAASVAVFAPGGDKPIRTIHDGIDNVESMAFDSRGYLYVTNHTGSVKDKGSIAVYGPGATKPTLTITQGVHYANQGILDGSDNLYVANDEGGISIYPRGTAAPVEIINRHLPIFALSLDAHDNLYALSTALFIYRPGKSRPFKTIANRDPFSLRLDSDNNVFVGDNYVGCGRAGRIRKDGCVHVLRQGSLVPWYQINVPSTPYALAFGPP